MKDCLGVTIVFGIADQALSFVSFEYVEEDRVHVLLLLGEEFLFGRCLGFVRVIKYFAYVLCLSRGKSVAMPVVPLLFFTERKEGRRVTFDATVEVMDRVRCHGTDTRGSTGVAVARKCSVSARRGDGRNEFVLRKLLEFKESLASELLERDTTPVRTGMAKPFDVP
jgi:hypothetical protein